MSAVELANWDRVRPYAFATIWVLATTVIGSLVVPWINHSTVGLLYIFGVVLMGLRANRGAVFFSAALSALAWDFAIIPPRFSFRVLHLDDGMMLGTYCIVAVVIGHLTSKLRLQELKEREREKTAMALYLSSRALAAAKDRVEAIQIAKNQARNLFGDQTLILIPESESQSKALPFTVSDFSQPETAVITRALESFSPSGFGTEFMPAERLRAYPVARGDRSYGILIYRPSQQEEAIIPELSNLLEIFAAQLGILLEREELRSTSEKQRVLAESTRLHRSLLDSVAHELKTPISVLSGTLQKLSDPERTDRISLVSEASIATARLRRLVNNLLNQSLLESGAIRAPLDWCNLSEILASAQRELGSALTDHSVAVELPTDFPLFRANPILLEQVFTNLLHNVARHTSPGTHVNIAAHISNDPEPLVHISVADDGAGLPPRLRHDPFQKFNQDGTQKTRGLGLGLSIVRGFIEAQGGKICSDNNVGIGAKFNITFPYTPHEEVPDE